ncbi:MAG: hypothetical protein KBT58_10005 [Bizionia sp.]|nr:hypothetical protein [Bizionia sp.]
MKENNKNLIGFFGIGAFFVLTIAGFSHLMNVILRDINFVLNTKPNLNYWTTELAILLFFTIVSLLAINWFFNNSESIKANIHQTLFAIIGFYFLFQLLQFLYTFYGTQIIMENYMENLGNYYDYLEEKPLYRTYSSLLIYIKYLIFGLLVYIKTKTTTNTM